MLSSLYPCGYPLISLIDIDVFGQDSEEEEDAIITVTEVKPQEPVVEEVKSQSLKRPGTVISHLDKIRAYEGECGAVTTTTTEEISPPAPTNLLKRYKPDDSEELKEKVERLAYHLSLERELRILEANKNNRRFAKLEREASEKDQEIVRLRQLAASSARNNATMATPRRVVKSKKATAAAAEPVLQQQQLDGFLTMPVTTLAIRNNNNAAATAPQRQQQPQAKSAKQVAKELENAHKLAIQQNFDAHASQVAQWYEQCDVPAHRMLIAYIEGGEANIGVSLEYHYRIAEYLQTFITVTQVGNSHLAELINHPFLANYRVHLVPNMHPYDAQQQQSPAFWRQAKRDVLTRESASVRYNISNVSIHANFIAKAIKFSADQSLGYRPVILQNFERAYSPEITARWYPRFDAGNGFLLTTDLKIPAVCTAHGQGRGKCCCFCGFEYIACNGGVLKHTHQVTGCDYLANASDDERVVLNIVLERRAIYTKFAKHKFISQYDENSLLRLATPEEIALGLYVTYAKTGEHLRLNMRVFLALRQTVYEEFLSRIDSLDTHTDNKNLDAKPFAHQLDCFGYSTASVAAAAANTTATKPKKPSPKKKKNNRADDNNNTPKVQKENGFLYKVLLDHQGGQFRKTKFSEDGKTSLRNFAINPLTGFGDDMYFSAAVEAPQILNAEQTDELNRRVEEEMAQTNAYFAMELEQQQQQQLAIMPSSTQPVEEYIRIDFSNSQFLPQPQQREEVVVAVAAALPEETEISFKSFSDYCRDNEEEERERQHRRQQPFYNNNNHGFGDDQYQEEQDSLYNGFNFAVSEDYQYSSYSRS